MDMVTMDNGQLWGLVIVAASFSALVAGGLSYFLGYREGRKVGFEKGHYQARVEQRVREENRKRRRNALIALGQVEKYERRQTVQSELYDQLYDQNHDHRKKG